MKRITAQIINRTMKTAREYGAAELILFGNALDPDVEPRDLDFACRGVDGWDFFGLSTLLRIGFGCRWTLCHSTPPLGSAGGSKPVGGSCYRSPR